MTALTKIAPDVLIAYGTWALVVVGAAGALFSLFAALYARQQAQHAQEAAKLAREDAKLAREHEAAMRTLKEEHVALLKREDARREAAEQKEELRAKTADVRARIGGGPTTHRWIIVKNYGPAEARNVRVRLDDVPIMEHELFAPQRPQQEEATFLAVEEEAFYKFRPAGNTGPHMRVLITWDDDSGKDRSWGQQLRIP